MTNILSNKPKSNTMGYINLARDTCIEVGDIVFITSGEKSLLTKLKESIQRFYSPSHKFHHPKIVSVAVCTKKNEHGVELYNHERPIKISKKRLRIILEDMDDKDRLIILQHLCNCDKTIITNSLSEAFGEKGAALNKTLPGTQEEIYSTLLAAIDKETITIHTKTTEPNLFTKIALWIKSFFKKPSVIPTKTLAIIELLMQLFIKTKRTEVLMALAGNSLIVYKHLSLTQRTEFINAYKKQQKITDDYYNKQKSRRSLIEIFSALFKSSEQDKYDKEKHEPAEETFCSRNVIETLNQIDSDIVKKGRYSLPATLEAGFHTACENKNTQIIYKTTEQKEIDWNAIRKNAPKFTREIISGEGRNLLYKLIETIELEYNRIKAQNNADKKKLDKQEKILAITEPYLPLVNSNSSLEISTQRDYALNLLAELWPVLQTNTGRFGVTPTSYKSIREFAHSQGLFDEDIEEKQKTLSVDKARMLEFITESNKQENITHSTTQTAIPEALDSTYTSGIDTYGTQKGSPPNSMFKSLNTKDKHLNAAYDRCEVFSTLELAIESTPKDPLKNFNMFHLGVTADDLQVNALSCDLFADPPKPQQLKSTESYFDLTATIQLYLSTEWQTLPSRHAEDTLTHIAISGTDKKDVEIMKSHNTQQYYIRAKNTSADKSAKSINISPSSKLAEKMSINYVLKSPITEPILNAYNLSHTHPDICALLLKYSSFSGEMPQETSNAEEYLQNMRKEKRGSCRLRAIACKEEMQRLYKDIQVNIVINPYHAYLEIKLDGKWQSYCLGGVNTKTMQLVAKATLASLECQSKFRFFSNAPYLQNQTNPIATAKT